ncbi:MAG: LysM peptidoglycan-binding domain-containing protein [Methanotrichaceae archaeon]
MIDPMQVVLQLTSKANLFPANSRYNGIDTASLETADGRTIVYLKRRFVPDPEKFMAIQEHTVVQGERLDNIAAHYIGDPEQFWRICDANGAIDPTELTEVPGRKLRISLPEGIAGINYG